MRTWKNRQRPSKSSHKKTVSRKQRGGELMDALTLYAWLNSNQTIKDRLKLDKLIQDALSSGEESPLVNVDLDKYDKQAFENWKRIKKSPLSSKPAAFTSVPPPSPPSPFSPFLRTLRPETSPSSVTLRAPPPPINPLLPFRAPGVVPGQQAVGAPVDQVDAEADRSMGPGAEDRLATVANINPFFRQPAGTSGLVYNLTSDGKTQTVQDCNAQLDELRKELESLRAGIVKTTATLKEREDSLSAQIAELTSENQKLSETGEAAQEAISALTETGKTTTEQLEAAREALAGKGAEFDDISKQLQTISAELGQANTLTVSQSEEIGKIKGALDESTRNSAKTERENIARSAKLLADHAAELERLKREHLTELAKLNRDLSSARDAASSVSKASDLEKKGLSDKIAELSAAIEAQKGEIGSLNSSLETVKTSLQQSHADSSEKSRAAAAAAGEAEAAAAKASADLAQLQAANAELAKQLDAAKEAAAAAREAAAESNKAKDAAAAAAAAANARADTAISDAEAAAATAAAAQANGKTSAREKAEAQAAAVKARAEAEQAEQAAQAAKAAMNDALETSQRAETAKAQAEANLAQLKSSTPKITLIYGKGEGDRVGGGDGRAARMGEELNVNWQRGAEDSSAWVFVMFSGGNPAYTQLILKPGMFSFQSTVGGDIKAVMFDVTVHSQKTLGF